jgi:predicted pyridoxine 5'-phosphate oxidase superfamily flavin-nucleotide-binding protein
MTPEVQQMLAAQLPLLATVTDGRTPNIGPKRSLRRYDDETLIFNENTGGQHLRNLQAGSQAAVAVVDREARDGYRLLGASSVWTVGEPFEAAVAYALEHGMGRPRAAVLIHIDAIYSLKPGAGAGMPV